MVLPSESVAPNEVFPLGYRFKVIRVYAASDTAKMIYLPLFLKLTLQFFEDIAVGVFGFPIIVKLPVSARS